MKYLVDSASSVHPVRAFVERRFVGPVGFESSFSLVLDVLCLRFIDRLVAIAESKTESKLSSSSNSLLLLELDCSFCLRKNVLVRRKEL
jgi:hypothetical protein